MRSMFFWPQVVWPGMWRLMLRLLLNSSRLVHSYQGCRYRAGRKLYKPCGSQFLARIWSVGVLDADICFHVIGSGCPLLVCPVYQQEERFVAVGHHHRQLKVVRSPKAITCAVYFVCFFVCTHK
jgi:hypothetical protein